MKADFFAHTNSYGSKEKGIDSTIPSSKGKGCVGVVFTMWEAWEC